MTRAAVLLVHGGREVGTGPVRRLDLPVLRMDLFRWSIRRALWRHDVEVRQVRFTQQGWNGTGESALGDLRRAIDDFALGTDAKIVLVGHSMGGRASMRMAEHPAVSGIVGLAPWLPDDEVLVDVHGQQIRVAHGSADRTTRPDASMDFVERARAAGADASHVLVPGEGHALLRQRRWWDRFIIESVLGILGTHTS